jgi:hypothetical protein
MWLNRRTLVGNLATFLLVSDQARAAIIVDSVGRSVPVPARVDRVFPADPPAAILLYTLAPELLLGWPRANRPQERLHAEGSPINYSNNASRLIQLTLKHRLPALFGYKENGQAGGLMSYAADVLDLYRRSAV